ncbi:hypothetical protein [Rhodococcus pyridinivorans]|uniref:hypothetical protein n=1 Tax=Rhodococcus pyridinivorans TaxID=103816 RepID=UPI00211E7438|nr:hypothetical protein [Rhodococcus pyridinivorans]
MWGDPVGAWGQIPWRRFVTPGATSGDLGHVNEVTSSNDALLLPLPFGNQPGGQIVIHEQLVGRGQVAGHDVVIVDIEVREDALIEVSAGLGISQHVVLMCIAEKCETGFELGGEVCFL